MANGKEDYERPVKVKPNLISSPRLENSFNNGSPFRTQLTNLDSGGGGTERKKIINGEERRLLTRINMRENVECRNLEREEMLNNIRKLTERHNMANDALKREESIRTQHVNFLKQTHETQIEIKNALVRNLEDIIDEQESKIFELESQNAGLIDMLPSCDAKHKKGHGVRQLRTLVDELAGKNKLLMQQVDHQRHIIETFEDTCKTSLANSSNFADSTINGDLVRDYENQLISLEDERNNLRDNLSLVAAQLDKLESSYKRLKLDYERLDIEKCEKLLKAERNEADLRKILSDERSKWKNELENNTKRLEMRLTHKNETFQQEVMHSLQSQLVLEAEKRKNCEEMLRKSEENYAKQVEETKKWRMAVQQLEIEMENQEQKYEDALLNAEKRFAKVEYSLHKFKRESQDYMQKQADIVISLDCFRASLKCIKEEQLDLVNTATSLAAKMQESFVAVRQRVCRSISDSLSQLMTKYNYETRLRKQYHNELMEIKGNIRVFARIRPPVPYDNDTTICIVGDSVDDRIVHAETETKRHKFELDNVFGADKSQADIFSNIRPLLTSCVDGYNVCIFAYGQTGSGKTHTMDGLIHDPGINPRALTALFEETESRRPDWKFEITVSMLEIYNDSIRDLLSGRAKLDIKLSTNGKIHVPGLTKMEVTRLEQINEILKIGRQNRVTASTKLNDVSSRSHAILIVHLKGENEMSLSSINAHLNLVDLAGSERLEKSGVLSGDRLKETQCINKSLSALGDVICALRNRRQHVPFRNSKLTYLLQDCLSGDSKTIMVVQLAPNSSSICETLCSLNFASRVKGVELGQASIHKTTNHFSNTVNTSDNSDDSLSSRKENSFNKIGSDMNFDLVLRTSSSGTEVTSSGTELHPVEPIVQVNGSNLQQSPYRTPGKVASRNRR